MELILKYFDAFTPQQLEQLTALKDLYTEWNEKINVISRKDLDSLYEKHVLHSLAIATVFDFVPGTKIMDMGCGGGFPGVPLAILFPEVEFVLCDSIAKKLKVVDAVAAGANIKNISTHWGRAEDYPKKLHFDFAVSRAVAPLKELWKWSQHVVKKTGNNEMSNGLICLKGGDLHQEISESGCKPMVWDLKDMFETEFFETKYMLYVKRG
jgi:16S rRNA (guanine527-N7)-methyltransferase